MATRFHGVTAFDAQSIVNCEVAFGHKSVLDLHSVSYNEWGFSGSSVSRLAAPGETQVAGLAIRFDTLIGDLCKRGILIK